MTRFFLSPSLEVVVASYGGVGTTFLSEEIGRYRRVNDPRDMDGYKHCPVPPIFGSPNLKVIYVVGNPILAVASLFGRGFHTDQAGKLQYSRLRRRFIDPNLTLEEYGKGGQDRFLFKEHFEAWTQTHVFYPTLILKYDAIYDSLDQVREFLNLPQEFLTDFLPQKERESSIDKISPETMDNLRKIYGAMESKIDSLPAFIKLNPSKKILSAYADRRYWLGIGRDFFWRSWYELVGLFCDRKTVK